MKKRKKEYEAQDIYYAGNPRDYGTASICTTRNELIGYASEFAMTLEDICIERKKMNITERFLQTFIAA